MRPSSSLICFHDIVGSDADAIYDIHTHARGMPRAINRLAVNALRPIRRELDTTSPARLEKAAARRFHLRSRRPIAGAGTACAGPRT